jgi:aminoglycoside phosphotransferase (APT) family kinase protein
MHDGQLPLPHEVAVRLVRRLVPTIDSGDVVEVSGPATTSKVFRVGDGLAARFGLVATPGGSARSDIEREHEAMRVFASASAVASPAPVAIGGPDDGYPLPWSLRTWVDGTMATPASMATSASFVSDVADVVARLRDLDVGDAVFAGEGRGGELSRHDAWVEECVARSVGMLPVDDLGRMWARLRVLPRESADAMCHGDLIPANLLASDGRLVGVLDTGGTSPADPALDLVVAWHMFDEPRRRAFRDRLCSDDLEWLRGAAWAFEQAIGLGWYYRDSNPVMAELGRSTLLRLLADSEIGALAW